MNITIKTFTEYIKDSIDFNDGSIFLFHGLAGVGKDTLANIFQNKFPEQIKIVHFAKPLKDMCLKMTHFIHSTILQKSDDSIDKPTIDCFYDTKKKELPFYLNDAIEWTPRKCMQWVGTDFMRSFNKDIWVKSLIEYILEEEKKAGKEYIWIIPDWRFSNEYELLEEYFEKKYFRDIITVNLNRANHKFNENVHNHISETNSIKGEIFELFLNLPCDLKEMENNIDEILKTKS